jgi:hypothetical protein
MFIVLAAILLAILVPAWRAFPPTVGRDEERLDGDW